MINRRAQNEIKPTSLHSRCQDEEERYAKESRKGAIVKEDFDVDQLEDILRGVSSRYQLQPFSWEELQQILNEKDFDTLSRSELQTNEYTRFRRELRVEWKSLLDYLLCHTFGFEERTDAETKLKHAYPSLEEYKRTLLMQQSQNSAETSVTPKLRLIPNKFQYFVGEDVEHWVLWKMGGGPCTAEEIDNAKNQLRVQQRKRVSKRWTFCVGPILLNASLFLTLNTRRFCV